MFFILQCFLIFRFFSEHLYVKKRHIFLFFSVFLIFRFFSEHLYVKKRHTLNANWQSIVVVLIIKKILYALQHCNY